MTTNIYRIEPYSPDIFFQPEPQNIYIIYTAHLLYVFIFCICLLSGCSSRSIIHNNIRPNLIIDKKSDFSIGLVVDNDLVNSECLATYAVLDQYESIIYKQESPTIKWKTGPSLSRILVNSSRTVCDDVQTFRSMPEPGTSDVVLRFSIKSSELVVSDRQTGMRRFREGVYSLVLIIDLYNGRNNTYIYNHIMAGNGYSYYYYNDDVSPSDSVAFSSSINKAHQEISNALADFLSTLAYPPR